MQTLKKSNLLDSDFRHMVRSSGLNLSDRISLFGFEGLSSIDLVDEIFNCQIRISVDYPICVQTTFSSPR